jgi:hypothetical protein
MSILTVEDFREELQRFAETTLKLKFDGLAASFKSDLSEHWWRAKEQCAEKPCIDQQASLRALANPTPPIVFETVPPPPAAKVAARSFVRPAAVASSDYLNQLSSLKPDFENHHLSCRVFPTPSGQEEEVSMQTEESPGQLEADLGQSPGKDLTTSETAMRQKLQDNLKRTRTWDEHRVDDSIALKIVTHPCFEWAVMIAIVLNSVYVGTEIDYLARQEKRRHETEFGNLLTAFEVSFIVLFVSELLLKVCAYRLRFCQRQTVHDAEMFWWNLYDCAVIGFEVIGICLKHLLGTHLYGVTVLRVLRFCRLLRIVRAVKLAYFVKDLRTIVASIANSMTLFFWALSALLLEMYIGGVFFTEIVRDYKLEYPDRDHTELTDLFGTLPRTCLSLLQAVTGGKDWCDILDPLEDVGLIKARLPFIAFVLFTLLAMMNVITGAFLDRASENAKVTEENLALAQARAIFAATDYNNSGRISWDEFEKVLQHKRVESFFMALDLDISEGRTLFDLLDYTGDGTVSADEFLCGCLRLRGNAKALDLLLLSREAQQLNHSVDRSVIACHKVSEENQKVVKANWEINKEQLDYLSECRSQSQFNSSLNNHILELVGDLRGMLGQMAHSVPPSAEFSSECAPASGPF